MQDLIHAVRSAGSSYDARLMLQSRAEDDAIGSALSGVPGVRSAGRPDKDHVRLITFHMDQRTMWSDLQKAALAIGADLKSPTPKA